MAVGIGSLLATVRLDRLYPWVFWCLIGVSMFVARWTLHVSAAYGHGHTGFMLFMQQVSCRETTEKDNLEWTLATSAGEM